MKPISILVPVLLAVAVLAAAYAAYQAQGGKPAEVLVVEGSVRPRSESRGIAARALGRVEAASEEIGVSSDITGRIAEILVEEGDVVAKGKPLARLEPFVYESRVGAAKAAVAQAAARKKLLEVGARREEIDVARALLDEAQASEILARKNWDRAQRLIEKGVVSQGEADSERRDMEAAVSRVTAARERLGIALQQTRKEELEAAQAELELRQNELSVAEAELEKTVLKAPIAGTVIRKRLRVGEAVSSFQVEPVVTISDMTHLRVRAEVDEMDIGRICPGQSVELELLAVKGKVLHGKVLRLGKSMGRKRVESNDPNEREDVRVLEVLIDIEEKEALPLGLRVIVTFLE